MLRGAWQVVAVDDCSSDDSLERLRAWTARVAGSALSVVVVAARDLGERFSRGPGFARNVAVARVRDAREDGPA